MTRVSGRESALPTGELTSLYQPPGHGFDEMLGPGGQLRPAWSRFAQGLDEIGARGLAGRADQVRRLLRENGVTYNVYGAARELDRPWELDPLPLLIPVSEWEPLASAIQQRAELLDRLLADLYGPQRLLKSGIVPPAVLFEHPNYLRNCVGIVPPGGVFLHWYAAQLARDASGRWIALGDRSQGPSGMGYAIENRLVVSRTLPRDFRNLNVMRLASFFMTLRDTLATLAQSQAQSDNPRIVLLTPGPRSSRYFEDVYLARYLGYTLVEGGDLTVRAGSVFLKTLGGLLPVDVVLRRAADFDCDPLDLRSSSTIGIPSLVQAARNGRVLIANALGSSLLEAPVIQTLLPMVCRELLGQELRLASTPAWWCGDPESLKYVEAHLDELLVRPAFIHRQVRTWAGWELSREGKQELLARIHQHPSRFVAQARIEGSTAPVWSDNRLQPWHVTLRAFAVAGPMGYQVMPGGLSRVTPHSELLTESMAGGQRSKDVWILSDQPVDSVSLLKTGTTALELRRSPNDLPSRAADYLFWLGRHIERAEATLRHVRCIIARMTSELQPTGIRELRLLVVTLSEVDLSPIKELSIDDPEFWSKLRAEIWAFLIDAERYGSLAETLAAARNTASVVRDRLSVDGWQLVHQMEAAIDPDAESADLGSVLLQLNHLLMLLSAFSGLSAESMTRGPGWRFLDMGRRIERSLQMLRVIRGLLVDTRTDLIPRLEAMLEIADSSMTYRYRYQTSLQLAPVLDLILADDSNPRAIGYQLAALAEHTRTLARINGTLFPGGEQQQVMAAHGELRLSDIEAFCESGSAGERVSLALFLDQMGNRMKGLSDSISHTYLTHTAPSRLLQPSPVEAARQV